MAQKPKISIITASKNGSRFLRETIESVRKQTFTDYEHVIADSVSTDDTIKILQEYKDIGYNLRWISKPDRHADEGFFNALQMATGEYIMLTCISDGYLDKNWFQKCVDLLNSNPDVSLVYGMPEHRREDGSFVKVVFSDLMNNPPPQKEDFLPFWLGTCFVYPENTFCVRASVFKECFPKFEPDGCFLQNHALLAFNYNFNAKGYLPYFLPIVASFGRSHHDSNNRKLTELNKAMKKQYFDAIASYENELLSGQKQHVFKNGNSTVTKTLENNVLERYRERISYFKKHKETFLGQKKSRLNRLIEKCRKLLCQKQKPV